jgi:phage terminase large subunit-like protein
LAQAARFKAGHVHVPEEAPWLATYLADLRAFPQGRNDDQVNSTSQALHYVTRAVESRHARPRPPGRARPIGRQPKPSIADVLR